MTILACVPAPNWVVLGAGAGAAPIVAADDLSLAIATSGAQRLFHPKTGAWADVTEICKAALRQFPRERPWTVGEFARAFARAYAHVIDATAQQPGGAAKLHALIGGVAPAEKLAAVFEVVLVAGQAPEVARVFEPHLSVADPKRLPSYAALSETLESATTLRKNPPARKVARLVRKLLHEARPEAHGVAEDEGCDVAIVSRDEIAHVRD